MRTYLIIALGAVAGLAVTGATAASLEDVTPGVVQLAQNPGAVDRTLGHSSMGDGEGIKRLPERPETDRSRDEKQRAQTYYESGHGDNDTDMEHRPRRTLGDREDD